MRMQMRVMEATDTNTFYIERLLVIGFASFETKLKLESKSITKQTQAINKHEYG